jgi:hypothetical protein
VDSVVVNRLLFVAGKREELDFCLNETEKGLKNGSDFFSFRIVNELCSCRIYN